MPTRSTGSSWRRLKHRDSGRIPCRGPFPAGHADLRRATWCETLEWNTGNTTGVSFFYVCDECKAQRCGPTA